MADRAKQAWVKHVVEPAWEVQFEPNSYGFRPGRSTWDAIGAISVQINQKPTWGLDADITKCFDRLDHEALLRKLNTAPTLGRQIKAWLQGGLLDQGAWFPTEAGTPQGGPRSPWLANVALHGLEEAIARAFPGRGTPAVIRYADDRLTSQAGSDRALSGGAGGTLTRHGMGIETEQDPHHPDLARRGRGGRV